jgi:hypothetical protein
MPRRKKGTKGRPLRWSVLAMNSLLDVADWEEFWGGAAEGRRAWNALKGTGHARPSRLLFCEPFWQYTPGVPEALRSYDGLAAIVGGPARDEWLSAHKEARRAWLTTHRRNGNG